MLINNFLENAARSYPEKIAIIHEEQRTTYAQIDGQAGRLAACLQQNNIKNGDRIALLLENNTDYVIAYYAILKAGAVAVPLNPSLKPDSLSYILQHLEPSAVITNFKAERLLKAVDPSTFNVKLLVIRSPKLKWNANKIDIVPYEEGLETQAGLIDPKIDENDLASIIYTSGSTGEPKGVMLSHKNIASNTKSICQSLDITHKDIQMTVLPFFYVMGKSLLNTHIAAGGTVVINNKFMYPAVVVQQMIQEKVTGFSGVPSTYAYLLNRSPLAGSRDKLCHLRYCSQAGGHMAKTLKDELRAVLPDHTKIFVMYGATEAAARLTCLDPNQFDPKKTSIGKPIPGVTIGLIDKDGKEVPDGQEGELVAQGSNIMQGYWRDPKSSAAVLGDRGYHTGDFGYRDKDGFLYIKRRKDGLLKTGGHRINPIEIEDFLLATDQLIETKIVGIPDKLLGKKLVALIVPKFDELDTEELRKICTHGLPGHKVPAKIVTVRALPKNASGKIDQIKCLQMASD